MRHPKKHIDYYRRQQMLLTAAFTLFLIALIAIVATGCSPKNNPATFSKPKYEVSTEHTTRGRANVRQKWGKNWWFWQKERRNTTPAP